MHRVFCPQANLKSDSVTISDPKEVHHLKNVLRFGNGDQICLFDAESAEAVGTILSIRRGKVQIRIDALRPQPKAKNKSIILICAIPKKAKFEFILEKCTELGVDEIFPMITQRTEVIPDPKKSANKFKRYQTVLINAAQQSRRVTVPQIHPPQKFPEVLKSLSKDTTSFIPCLTGEREGLMQIFKREHLTKRIAFLIGPEGDFTLGEVALARGAGCIPVSLGDLILKVDTAAISVVAAAHLFFNP